MIIDMTALEKKWKERGVKSVIKPDLNFNPIPPITDPMGVHWDQPDREKILVDDKVAVMDQKAFEELLDYSNSQPTGCYPGKMWKAQYGKPKEKRWFLCWFGYSEKGPQWCSNNYREILIA